MARSSTRVVCPRTAVLTTRHARVTVLGDTAAVRTIVLCLDTTEYAVLRNTYQQREVDTLLSSTAVDQQCSTV